MVDQNPTTRRHPYAEAVQVSITEISRLTNELNRLRVVLTKAETAMRLHGWQLCLGSDEFGSAEAFAAWEAVDDVLHPDEQAHS